MLKFAKQSAKTRPQIDGKYKILIVDDEPEVHNITKAVLKKFTFENKGLEFLCAYSGKEALEIMDSNDDIALILLDVVMETDDAGLKVAKIIRTDFNNITTRIILRTGQPGIAPIKDVILNYEIDDYKDKSELTSDKLFVTVVSALRSVRNIKKIQEEALKQREFKTKVRTSIVNNNQKYKELEEKITTLQNTLKNTVNKDELKLYLDKIKDLENTKQMQASQINAYETELMEKETIINNKNARLKEALFRTY
jgi:CheY-like chemotaxis protein